MAVHITVPQKFKGKAPTCGMNSWRPNSYNRYGLTCANPYLVDLRSALDTRRKKIPYFKPESFGVAGELLELPRIEKVIRMVEKREAVPKHFCPVKKNTFEAERTEPQDVFPTIAHDRHIMYYDQLQREYEMLTGPAGRFQMPDHARYNSSKCRIDPCIYSLPSVLGDPNEWKLDNIVNDPQGRKLKRKYTVFVQPKQVSAPKGSNVYKAQRRTTRPLIGVGEKNQPTEPENIEKTPQPPKIPKETVPIPAQPTKQADLSDRQEKETKYTEDVRIVIPSEHTVNVDVEEAASESQHEVVEEEMIETKEYKPAMAEAPTDAEPIPEPRREIPAQLKKLNEPKMTLVTPAPQVTLQIPEEVPKESSSKRYKTIPASKEMIKMTGEFQELISETNNVRGEKMKIEAAVAWDKAEHLVSKGCEISQNAMNMKANAENVQQQALDMKNKAAEVRQLGMELQEAALEIKQKAEMARDKASGVKEKAKGMKSRASRLKSRASQVKEVTEGYKEKAEELKESTESMRDQAMELQEKATELQFNAEELKENGISLRKKGEDMRVKAKHIKQMMKEMKEMAEEMDSTSDMLKQMAVELKILDPDSSPELLKLGNDLENLGYDLEEMACSMRQTILEMEGIELDLLNAAKEMDDTAEEMEGIVKTIEKSLKDNAVVTLFQAFAPPEPIEVKVPKPLEEKSKKKERKAVQKRVSTVRKSPDQAIVHRPSVLAKDKGDSVTSVEEFTVGVIKAQPQPEPKVEPEVKRERKPREIVKKARKEYARKRLTEKKGVIEAITDYFLLLDDDDAPQLEQTEDKEEEPVAELEKEPEHPGDVVEETEQRLETEPHLGEAVKELEQIEPEIAQESKKPRRKIMIYEGMTILSFTPAFTWSMINDAPYYKQKNASMLDLVSDKTAKKSAREKPKFYKKVFEYPDPLDIKWNLEKEV